MGDDDRDEPTEDRPEDEGDDRGLHGSDWVGARPLLPPGFLDAARAAGQWQRLAETAANTIRPFNGLRIPAADFQPAITALLQQQRLAENLLRDVRPFDDLHERLMTTATWQPQLDVFREFARRFPTLGLPTRWLPPNWSELTDLDIDVAMDIVVNECVPLAWVPHPKLVAEIVAAADANERDKILASSHENIAEHCLTVLDEISTPDLKPLAELAVDAVEALRGGHGPSAQALAASVFDTLLRDAARRGVIFVGPPIGYFKYDKLLKRIEPVSDDTPLQHFRAACVLSTARAAIKNYDPSDPPPARFVRHATAHRAGPVQYTPANSAVAVMLMVSMLREAQESGWQLEHSCYKSVGSHL